MGFCSKGLKNEFETAMVNEPSVFEPLEFYCICHSLEIVHSLMDVQDFKTIKINKKKGKKILCSLQKHWLEQFDQYITAGCFYVSVTYNC